MGACAVARIMRRIACGRLGVQAELAEHVEAVLAAETKTAAGVRLGRGLAATLTAEEAKDADRVWLEGCVWAAARASGLEWCCSPH